MKKPIIYTALFIAVSVACTQTAENFESQPIPESRKVSENFAPANFEQDQRAEIIRSMGEHIHELIVKHAEDRKIPGIAYGVVVDGELVVEGATGLMNIEENLNATTESCFRIASMSKSFAAMAIVKLRDEGKLSLDDPVIKFVPEFSDFEYLTSDSPEIDIENLLTMTAGFPEDNPWGDRQLDETNQMLLDLMSSPPSLSNPPSIQYEYSNTGYALLGYIISQASGIPYQQYITENILVPLGMNETYYEFDDVPEGKLVAGYRWEDEQWKSEPMLHDGSYGVMGGMITTIKDFSKYVSFHLSAWPPRSGSDNGPIKRSSLREMHTPQFPRLYANAKDDDLNPCPIVGGYGYGLSIGQDCKGLKWVTHGGALPGFGSNYVFYPEYGIGLMAFGNLTYTSPWPLQEIRKLIFDNDSIVPRKLPPSQILLTRQQQIVELINTWDEDLESEILAENFYLDRSRDSRMEEINALVDQVGSFIETGEMDAFNQLRGIFGIQAENGKLSVYFTLSPEPDPKVQYLRVSISE